MGRCRYLTSVSVFGIGISKYRDIGSVFRYFSWSTLKIIGKEFQTNCYKTIFRKINTEDIFFQLTLITNKDYFSRKKLFTVAVYVIYIYGRDVIGANCECL